ncbi:hypothetical protein [Nocardiopsis metallicus]|uniref:Uncharacterized protein n=1 Tax=Nocardiopsis metallicus TaxID=179819 RepID=A0A840WFK3_9ACTN|nr:hypothetical protein [Nocardiopsis metallicus]MBB5490735.1 hypothetical protein [Nocardiopsis metallicus]
MTAMESQFAAFGQWCADNGECALHGQDVAQLWQELLVRAAEEPLPADGVSYGRAELSLMGGSLARNEFSWEWLAEAIGSALENGDAIRFQEITGEIFYMPNLVAADVRADGRPFDGFAGYQEYTEFTVGLSENPGHGRGCSTCPARPGRTRASTHQARSAPRGCRRSCSSPRNWSSPTPPLLRGRGPARA